MPCLESSALDGVFVGLNPSQNNSPKPTHSRKTSSQKVSKLLPSHQTVCKSAKAQKENTMKNLKTAALVAIAALSANFATLAAPDYANTDVQAVVSVNMWSNASLTTEISALRLFDNSELTWLQYGFSSVNGALRIKEVVGNKNIKVTLGDADLTGSENQLSLDFDVTSDGASFGVHQMIVVLENAKTGATAAVGINVVIE
jgi:hypothetical protein